VDSGPSNPGPAASLDHLVGTGEDRFMNCEPHGFGGGEVDDQLELRGPLDRQIGVVNCHGARGRECPLRRAASPKEASR
jgi:hypothetical protein